MESIQPMAPGSAPHPHAHDACVQDAVSRAEALCLGRGVRLTAQRRRVLELVWSGHRPIGAYEILDRLQAEGQKAAPPTVYRALDFLLENGLIHRLESLNAFVGCPKPDAHHASVFLICLTCQEVSEATDPATDLALAALAARQGFGAQRRTIELAGVCARCAA